MVSESKSPYAKTASETRDGENFLQGRLRDAVLKGRLPVRMAYCEGAAVAQVAGGHSSAETIVFPEQVKQTVEITKLQQPTYTAFDICNSLLAGGIAGGVSRSAVAPLERLKILLQVQSANNTKYNGMFQGLKTMWQSEGIRGFFRGNGTNCIRIIPNSAVKFLCFDVVSDTLLWLARAQPGKEDMQKTPLINLCSGAIAGIIAMTSVYPLDMVRGRITVQTVDSPQKYRGILHAITTVAKEEGVVVLYRGWIPSLIGVVPYVGLNFAVYETLKDVCVRNLGMTDGKKEDLGYLTRFTCGASAGIVGQTVAYPLDVIRRRMQMVGRNYSGMTDAFKQTIKYEGFGALYKGLLPNSVKVVPSIAISFVTYEYVRELLGVKFRIPD